jgi:6-phosphogluconolactonase
VSIDGPRLLVEIVPANDLASATAAHIVERARETLAERGRFVLAVSGGSTPGPMLSALFAIDVDWPRVVILQVDERVAPAGHADRNLTDLRARLADTPAEAAELCAMPVGDRELAAAADGYASPLRRVAGDPPVIDLVQLGLGGDGHTASLVPGDPSVVEQEADVAVTGEYEGRSRMTLTFPALNRARHIVWMIGGAAKAEALHRLVAGDASIPATRVRRDAIVFADPAAAGRRDQSMS